MSDSVKQSPLGVNVLGSMLQNQGLTINPRVTELLGTSKNNANYAPGSLIEGTCLANLTYAINDAFNRGEPGREGIIGDGTIKGTTLTVTRLDSGVLKPGMQLWDETQLIKTSPATTLVTLLSGDPTNSGSTWTINQDQKTGTNPSGIIANVVMTANIALANCTVNNNTYSNLISVGSNTIPALGNSKPPKYVVQDPSNQWTGQATTGYGIIGPVGQGQDATWIPYNLTNPNKSITQWGYLRLLALQGWNDFNWNGVVPVQATPEYKDFTSSFLTAEGFVSTTNQTIFTMNNAKNFMDGTFSNMDDLITADVTGVNLSVKNFGLDLINLGNALDLSTIATFGLPSNLLRTLQRNNALTQDVAVALLAADLAQSDLTTILNNAQQTVTKEQEQKIYGAFLVVVGESLFPVLDILNCKTQGIESLADLLNVKKMFPNSYASMTVPIYNTTQGPTNSKTYYLLFSENSANPQLSNPVIVDNVGVSILPGTPAIATDTIATDPFAGLDNAKSLESLLPQIQTILNGRGSSGSIRDLDLEDYIEQVSRNVEDFTGKLKK